MMGIIIKTDLFPETLDDDLESEEILENPDKYLSQKYSLREIFLSLGIFAIGVVFGALLMKIM